METMIKNSTVETQGFKDLPDNVKGNLSDFDDCPLDILADYIQYKHHRFLKNKIPVISQKLEKLCLIHGMEYLEIFEIAQLFNVSSGDLGILMKKQELVLFPYIKVLVGSQEIGKKVSKPFFETIIKPIQNIIYEHEKEKIRFKKILALMDSYELSANVGKSHIVTFAMLREFENHLRSYIDIANNNLFPGAIELEREMVH
ncbi:MAG: iron-sulfur cluster repair di-iron protein [Cyclobacteriaceae bacterium]